jgi:CHASE3 domain sensor protein
MKLLRRDSISSKVEEMERVLKALRSGSDEQASNILARLRLGERLEEVANGLPPATLPSTQSKPPR